MCGLVRRVCSPLRELCPFGGRRGPARGFGARPIDEDRSRAQDQRRRILKATCAMCFVHFGQLVSFSVLAKVAAANFPGRGLTRHIFPEISSAQSQWLRDKFFEASQSNCTQLLFLMLIFSPGFQGVFVRAYMVYQLNFFKTLKPPKKRRCTPFCG